MSTESIKDWIKLWDEIDDILTALDGARWNPWMLSQMLGYESEHNHVRKLILKMNPRTCKTLIDQLRTLYAFHLAARDAVSRLDTFKEDMADGRGDRN